MSLVTVAESYRAILCMVSANTAFIYLLQSPQNTTHSFVHMNIIRWVCNFQSASQFFFCLKQFCLLFYIHFCYLFDCDKYSIGFILFVSAKNVHMQTRNSIWFLHMDSLQNGFACFAFPKIVQFNWSMNNSTIYCGCSAYFFFPWAGYCNLLREKITIYFQFHQTWINIAQYQYMNAFLRFYLGLFHHHHNAIHKNY